MPTLRKLRSVRRIVDILNCAQYSFVFLWFRSTSLKRRDSRGPRLARSGLARDMFAVFAFFAHGPSKVADDNKDRNQTTIGTGLLRTGFLGQVQGCPSCSDALVGMRFAVLDADQRRGGRHLLSMEWPGIRIIPRLAVLVPVPVAVAVCQRRQGLRRWVVSLWNWIGLPPGSRSQRRRSRFSTPRLAFTGH